MGAAFPVLLGSHGCFEARTTGSSNTCTDPWRDGIPCAPQPPLSPWSCSPVPFSHPCDLPCVRQGTGLSSHRGAGLPLPLQGPQQECGGPGMGGSSGICPRMLQDAGKKQLLWGAGALQPGNQQGRGRHRVPRRAPRASPWPGALPRLEHSMGAFNPSLPVPPRCAPQPSQNLPFVPCLKINHFGMNSMPVNNASPAVVGM